MTAVIVIIITIIKPMLIKTIVEQYMLHSRGLKFDILARHYR